MIYCLYASDDDHKDGVLISLINPVHVGDHILLGDREVVVRKVLIKCHQYPDVHSARYEYEQRDNPMTDLFVEFI